MNKTKRKCCIPDALIATFQKGKQWVEMTDRLMTGSEGSIFIGAAS